MRIKSQKCRDIPKLYNIIRKIPWKTYLNQETCEVKVSAKKSRLIHTGKIEEAFFDGLKDHFKANSIKTSLLEAFEEAPKQVIFLRFFEDELTISLDTSGDLLHIRGNRSFRGHASIRENIASILLYKLTEDLPETKYNLIDPMCGTGTFLFEWRDQFKKIDRNFLYQSSALTPLSGEDLTIKKDKNHEVSFFGFDQDKEIIDKLKGTPNIAFEVGDVFKPKTLEGTNIIIINPPYGKRVKIKGDKIDYFRDLIDAVAKNYSPMRLGIIIPRDFVGSLPGERTYFKQNGIDVCFLVQKR